MNYTKKFERELLQERKYKEVCRENHELIENKYIEIFGKENYDSNLKSAKENILKHYKLMNSIPHVVKTKKIRTVEEVERQEDYIYILPFVERKLFSHFESKGLEIGNIEQFLELCKS